MTIRPIRNERDHGAALSEIEKLWKSKPGTPAGDRLDVLITLVEAYEKERFPIDVPDPVDAIQFRLEMLGLETKALIGVIGTRSRVHEVLTGKRPLSLTMIRRLHERFGIPAEVLIREPRSRKPKRAA